MGASWLDRNWHEKPQARWDQDQAIDPAHRMIKDWRTLPRVTYWSLMWQQWDRSRLRSLLQYYKCDWDVTIATKKDKGNFWVQTVLWYPSDKWIIPTTIIKQKPTNLIRNSFSRLNFLPTPSPDLTLLSWLVPFCTSFACIYIETIRAHLALHKGYVGSRQTRGVPLQGGREGRKPLRLTGDRLTGAHCVIDFCVRQITCLGSHCSSIQDLTWA